MAQLVVRLRDRTHSDPAVQSTLYVRGDVVDVFPDGKLAMPQPVEHWAVVQVTGLSVDRAKQFLLEQDTENGNVVRRRLRGFGWTDLPVAVQNALLTQRHYTTTLTAVRNYIRNRRTGAQETL